MESSRGVDGEEAFGEAELEDVVDVTSSSQESGGATDLVGLVEFMLRVLKEGLSPVGSQLLG